MKKHDKVDWPNLNLIVLPTSQAPSEHEAQLREIGQLSDDNDLSEAFFYVSDPKSPQTVRLYVGDTIAAILRRESEENGVPYMETIKVRLLVSLMEFHIHEPDGETASDCVLYARTLTRLQVVRAFNHLDVYSNDPQYGLHKHDIYALIQFIQGHLGR